MQRRHVPVAFANPPLLQLALRAIVVGAVKCEPHRVDLNIGKIVVDVHRVGNLNAAFSLP